MTVVRKIYPEELWEHLRDQIEEVFKVSLSLNLCDTGDEISFHKDADLEDYRAVLVDLLEDDTVIGDPLGDIDVSYDFEIHFVRTMDDGDRPKKGLIGPLKALREFFLRDNYELPLFSQPGHEILTAIPGRCSYGTPEVLRSPDKLIEQGTFPMTVRARSRPVPL